MLKVAKTRDGGLFRPDIFVLTIPQVEGGANISVKVRWSQKLLYNAGQFSLCVPFSFPEFVNPAAKVVSQTEKIELNINSGTSKELLCKNTSHPLKEIRRQAGQLGFLYEADVKAWSSTDFTFSYEISSHDSFGGFLLQSPLANDLDQREIFCFYLFPGNNEKTKVFKKDIVYLLDMSGSMQGKPLENVKHALFSALFELSPEDSFTIIGFNEEIHMFSSSLEVAKFETIEKAIQWTSDNLVARGGANILLPLTQALDILHNSSESVPLIFLVTDGAVEDERQICNVVKGHITNRGTISPRISTFGIGAYCNHYFLKMLSVIGRGCYDAAWELDSIEARLRRLFATASSVTVANITIDTLDHLNEVEVYPSCIPDLLSGIPLIVSGRYQGNFPGTLKASGLLEDNSSFETNLTVQKAKGIALDKVVARQQIEHLTAQAWYLESKQLEDEVAKLSIQNGLPSEYTRFLLIQTDTGNQNSELYGLQRVLSKINLQKAVDSKGPKIIVLQSLGFGFGNVAATADNAAPGFGETKMYDQGTNALVKAASRLCDCCCCMCVIQTCSAINNQCAIVLTQLCSALSCFGCLSCCAEVCCDF
ncbi:hypothetical protein Sjap_011941 [Stephania japonica]|uniref:VWFA domain-containing protein n=1 Tax=Stephania japonica TaxID=461633 RepID=A0AAP0P606_9MAGN